MAVLVLPAVFSSCVYLSVQDLLEVSVLDPSNLSSFVFSAAIFTAVSLKALCRLSNACVAFVDFANLSKVINSLKACPT